MTRSPATDPAGIRVDSRDGVTPEPREAPEVDVATGARPDAADLPVAELPAVAETPAEGEAVESEAVESEAVESAAVENVAANSVAAEESPPTEDAPPISDNRRRAQRTAPLFAELATLEKDDPRRERLREILVEEHLPLVRHFARRFSNRGEPFDDLLQVGTLGLIAAIDRFDPTRGVEFLSFAVPTITGEIKRHFRDQGWSVRVPRRLQELHLSLNAAVGELAQKNGRAPTPSELAQHLGIPREEVLEGLAVANAYRSSSLDERLSGDDDSPTLAATLGEEDAALEGVEYRESLQPLLATIPARERRILILRFFGNMTQSQIAADIGISQMHVSRLLSQTLAKLREGLLKD
ncbi:RNA polymerase sigma factor SigF [Blastococcus goldschmidtiae]|uniref:SigB/SigF/SigG family RNA polymerase sigma factor n=1 Tax=Blastococcus goldschmidtiae TaxID=3075546 RepID=A0ABU2K521_9ACTN|nr:SigB/SigF/SigG family RNA polymerase sigma factor [Blastococcus sp. DSM 46792]MDT0275276.1 SigB/SigF/SigG family RNA polymerase sigma factor [Blastococcus sp. DSM 46792]